MESIVLTDEAEKAKALMAQGEQADQLLMKDLETVFGTEAGNRVLLWLMQEASVGETVFTGNSKTYHNAGAQDFCNDLIDWVRKADLEIYIKVIRLQEQLRQDGA